MGLLTISSLLLTLMPLQPLHAGGNGFAASIVGAFLALGLLGIVAKFATTKPRRRPPRTGPRR